MVIVPGIDQAHGESSEEAQAKYALLVRQQQGVQGMLRGGRQAGIARASRPALDST